MYYKLGQTCLTIWGNFIILEMEQMILQIKVAQLL